MILPRGHSPDELRHWIVEICQRRGIAPTTLAKAAGLAPSTINRFIAGTGPNLNISARTIEAIASVFRPLDRTDADVAARKHVEGISMSDLARKYAGTQG